MKRSISILAIVVLSAGQVLLAQQLTADKANSKIEIKGTSSLHDWESIANEYSISVTQSENTLTNLKGTIKVKSIQSGKSIMDDKTYEALEADKFPEIKMEGTNLTIDNGKLTGSIQVTIKNVTKTFDIASTSTVSGGNVKVNGEVPLDMTEFGIEPPTAMFGTLETGKDITIAYSITLK